MKIVRTIEELKNIRKDLKGSIGFVPTMGALHDGHISLIKESRANDDFVIVSIFVNPTQFLANEDLSTYPRKEEADIKICQMCKVDILFLPEISTIYEKSEILIKAPQNSYVLEGFSRPGHFDGVLQIVLKLFNLTNPSNAYFGKKDAQQLSLIKQMVKNLFLPVNIVACPIIRQNDGLALSSRNVYLTDEQKQEALKISKSIYMAGNLISKGERDSKIVINKILEVLLGLDVEYVKVVNHKFDEIDIIEPTNTIILVVVRFGNIRLLDNIWM